MLATRSTVEYCITFFVAFHVLTEIDNFYAESVSSYHLMEAIEEPLEITNSSKTIKFRDRSLPNMLVFIIYKVLSILFNSVHYYYTPFFVNFIPYYWTI